MRNLISVTDQRKNSAPEEEKGPTPLLRNTDGKKKTGVARSGKVSGARRRRHRINTAKRPEKDVRQPGEEKITTTGFGGRGLSESG